MAAQHHQRVDPPCPLGRYHPQVAGAVDSIGGQKQPGVGQLFAAHGDSALVKVGAEHFIDIVAQPPKGFHKVG